MNNFINSTIFVDLAKPPIVDRNYWSNYTAEYPNATEVDNSGIWDTPNVYDKFIGGSHGDDPCIDYHPLMKPVIDQWSSEETETSESQQQEFPTTFVAVASVTSIAVTCIGLLLYFKKRKH